MQLKTSKWGDVKWTGVREGRYALELHGSRRLRFMTTEDEGCYVQRNAQGTWDVVVFGEVAETERLKVDAQWGLLEYLR
jgi:hypothetical protein